MTEELTEEEAPNELATPEKPEGLIELEAIDVAVIKEDVVEEERMDAPEVEGDEKRPALVALHEDTCVVTTIVGVTTASEISIQAIHYYQ